MYSVNRSFSSSRQITTSLWNWAIWIWLWWCESDILQCFATFLLLCFQNNHDTFSFVWVILRLRFDFGSSQNVYCFYLFFVFNKSYRISEKLHNSYLIFLRYWQLNMLPMQFVAADKMFFYALLNGITSSLFLHTALYFSFIM